MSEERSEKLEEMGIVMGKIGRDLERFGRDMQALTKEDKSDLCESLKRRKNLMERDNEVFRELLPSALKLVREECS